VKIVDDNNPIPKYLQISAWLKELIENGRYQKGEKLPSEREGDRDICVRACTRRIKAKTGAYFKHNGIDARKWDSAEHSDSWKTG
jgi:hypothetical protein